ncbi:SNF2 family N-terminal domain-containing protein [Hypoxylon rubiginosum]|uniref:SNF2 family N-terminal domain-containing protein n=1 Tax=Hypoxylon rubiginosum TaxID=110542 RepID=A0ACB9YQA2_9PEZI|nr:SNF2 family N-terminal domain-containing protein [Hypoxylon rubiginosum]
MNEKQSPQQTLNLTSPALGVKRSWDSTDPWLEINEDSTATCTGPSKRTRFSRSSSLQDPVVSEASCIDEPILSPSLHSPGFEGTASVEPITPGSDTPPSIHLKQLPDAAGVSGQQYNITTTWPVLDFATSQPSDLIQHNYFASTEDSTISRSDNFDVVMNDSVDDGDGDGDGDYIGPTQCNEGVPGAPSSEAPTSESRDYICLNEDLYDSCFGVITFENFRLQHKFFNGKVAKNVSLEVNGTLVIIKDAISNKYGGLLDQNAARIVVNLIKNYNVELSASIKAPKRIEVLIYGLLRESDSVGDMLLEQDCFLQQPDWYDATRRYHNPQCLLHPDKETETPWMDNGISSAHATCLGENEKSKVTELLDSATGPSTFRRVEISDILVTELKNHQKKALSMMIEKEAGCTRDAEFPSVWVESSETDPSYARFYNTVTQRFIARTPRFCLGGLLADDMGLGKTLTTLALITTSLGNRNEHSGGTLIVCPMTKKHFKTGSLTYRIYHGSARDNNVSALHNADIVLTSYETLRAGLPHDQVERMGLRESRRSSLLHGINWHRVVLDEAHIVRNRASKTSHAVKILEARHRWCLTGTPIHNRLEDLGSLVEFLRVDPFDDLGVFDSIFIAPINGGRSDAWERLRLLIKAIALRRTKKALDADLSLPPRWERIHEVHLDDEENTLYDLVKRYFMRSIDSGGSVMNTFQLILRLRQICNHGKDLLPQNLQAWLHQVSVFGDATLPQLQRCEACDISLDGEDESSYCVFSCFHQVCQACLENRDLPNNSSDSICPLCNPRVDSTTTPEPRSMQYRPSSKVKALLKNLRVVHQATVISVLTAHSVVFSTWTGMLDFIGKALSVNGFIYERLDGSKNLAQRRSALGNFRSSPDCTVLLASLGSAAVGLDLTMASHVHLMEPGWNPLLEQQAMDRVYRLGQESEVVATRYIVSGQDSIEQYIRQRQVWKMNLIASSLDDSGVFQSEVKAISKGDLK